MSTFTGADVTVVCAKSAQTASSRAAQTWKVFCPVDIEVQSFATDTLIAGTYTLKIDTVIFASAAATAGQTGVTFTPAAPVVLAAGVHTFELKNGSGSVAWYYQGYSAGVGPALSGTGADYIGWGCFQEYVGSLLCPPGSLVFKIADGTRMSKIDGGALSGSLAAQTWSVTFDAAISFCGLLKRLSTQDLTGYVLKIDGTSVATRTKVAIDGAELTSMSFVPAAPVALAAGAHTFKIEPSANRVFAYRAGTGTAPSGDPHTTAWGAWSESPANQVEARLFYSVAIVAPNVPTGLTTSGETNTQITLTWVAPTSGDAPTGYDVRVDGGAPTDAGNVLTYDFTGLTPGTSYTLEVRAYNTGGDSSWVSVDAETILDGPLAAYAATVRIGSHTWEIEAGDPADGALDVLAGASFQWSAPDDVGWPPPMWTVPRDVCQLRVRAIDAADVEDVRKGDVVRFKFTPFGYDFSAPLIDFAGIITGDPVITDDPAAGVFLTVAASDYRVILSNWSIDAGDGSAPTFNNGDTIEEALQAWCDVLTGQLAGRVPGAFGDVTVGAVDPNSRLTGTLGADITYSGFVSGLRGFQDLHVIPVPQYDDAGDLDPVQPFRMVQTDDYGRDYDTPDPIPAALVPNATIEWRRDYTPTVLEVVGVQYFYQGAAQGLPFPTDMSDEIVLRVSSADSFHVPGLENEVPETDPWGPYAFTVRAWDDAETVRDWFNYPNRIRQYISIDGIELVKNPAGAGTVAGMLKSALFTIADRGQWSVRAGMRRHHFDATLT